MIRRTLQLLGILAVLAASAEARGGECPWELSLTGERCCLAGERVESGVCTGTPDACEYSDATTQAVCECLRERDVQSCTEADRSIGFRDVQTAQRVERVACEEGDEVGCYHLAVSLVREGDEELVLRLADFERDE